MMDPATAERAAELELVPGFGFWVNGRAGFLGDVDADVAAAAIGFMAPQSVRDWGVRGSGMMALDVTMAFYAEAASAWGRRTMAGIDAGDLDRLAALCDKVAAAALPSCGLLFAGWRALDRSDDPASNATVALNVSCVNSAAAPISARSRRLGSDPSAPSWPPMIRFVEGRRGPSGSAGRLPIRSPIISGEHRPSASPPTSAGQPTRRSMTGSDRSSPPSSSGPGRPSPAERPGRSIRRARVPVLESVAMTAYRISSTTTSKTPTHTGSIRREPGRH